RCVINPVLGAEFHDLGLVVARFFVLTGKFFLPSAPCFWEALRDAATRRDSDALFPFRVDVSSASMSAFARLIPSAADSKSYIAELLSAYCLTTEVSRT